MKKSVLSFTLFDFYRSPILILAAAPLVIMATSRLSFSMISGLALLWVYGLSVAITHCAKRLFPKTVFNNILSLLLFSFVGALFLFILELLNPLLALETSLLVLLTPVLCYASDIALRTEDYSLSEALYVTFCEAICIALFLLALSLLREPLGYSTLTLPGGDEGIIELFSIEDGEHFPVQLVACSTGALFFLGYFFFVYRLMKPRDKTLLDKEAR